MERTMIIFKPDAVERALVGRILCRFEEKGLKIVGMKFIKISEELAAGHYAEHVGKPFYERLVSFITSVPVVVACLEAPRCIEITRNLLGKTYGFDAEPGTVRGDFSTSRSYNLVHASDSLESAEREIALYFNNNELISWIPNQQRWYFHEDDLK
ncbi:MAG: nucleoside-diphosphate kinase [Planctomycetes bacterium]|nr:nucleoside-diphosphate kinase [Planctomycetota bacterium]